MYPSPLPRIKAAVAALAARRFTVEEVILEMGEGSTPLLRGQVAAILELLHDEVGVLFFSKTVADRGVTRTIYFHRDLASDEEAIAFLREYIKQA